MHRILAIVTALLVAASALVIGGSASAQSKSEIVIGVQCDRTGPTQIVGTTAGGMISPDSTRKLTRPFHRPRRRCSTYATMAEVTAMIVTLATVRMVLLM